MPKWFRFNRNQIQRSEKLGPTKRVVAIPGPTSQCVTIIEDGRILKAEVVRGAESLVGRGGRVRYQAPKYKRYVNSAPKNYYSQAATIVTEATRQMTIEGVGVVKLSELEVTPEIAHSIGSLVVAHAIRMAKQKDAAKGGDEERSCEIIKAIGHTGLDLVISPSGSIITRVSTKPVKKRKSKRKKSSESGATEAAVEESAVAATSGSVEPDDNKDAVNSGQHIVVKSENGKTTIHVDKLQIFMTIQFVDQLNVNPQQVINQLQNQLTGLKGAIEANTVEYKLDEKKENADEDNKK